MRHHQGFTIKPTLKSARIFHFCTWRFPKQGPKSSRHRASFQFGYTKNGDSRWRSAGLCDCRKWNIAAKKFCNAFDGQVEKLSYDMHADFKWCTDYKEHLADICMILNIPSTFPQRYVPTRWLSILGVTNNNINLLPALTVFTTASCPKRIKLYTRTCLKGNDLVRWYRQYRCEQFSEQFEY